MKRKIASKVVAICGRVRVKMDWFWPRRVGVPLLDML